MSKEYVFGQLAEEYDFWQCTVSKPGKYQTVTDFLPLPAGAVLDIGCGAGQLALTLADFAEQVTGIDSAAEMIRLAKQRQAEQAKANVQFIHASVETWPCAAQQFDFIVSDKALHHTDLASVLPRVRDWLRPGGRIFVRDFASTDLEHRRNPYWQYKKAWRELRALKGLEPKTWWRIARFRLHPAWINCICQDKVLPRQQAKIIYQHYFPGCTLIESREQILMLWENVEK